MEFGYFLCNIVTVMLVRLLGNFVDQPYWQHWLLLFQLQCFTEKIYQIYLDDGFSVAQNCGKIKKNDLRIKKLLNMGALSVMKKGLWWEVKSKR